jgi:hypothetical protein
MATVSHLGILPWCDSASPEDENFESAVTISASEATLLYWRAKKIGVREFHEESIPFSMGGVSLLYSEPDSPTIKKETDLVCGTNFVTHSASALNSSDSVSLSASYSFVFSIFYNKETTGPEDEYLLRASGSVFANGSWFIDQGTPQAAVIIAQYASAIEDPTGGSVPYIASTLDLNGRLLEFNSNGFSNVLGPSTFGIGNPTTIDENIDSVVFSPPFPNFEILEYWPYAT